MKEEEINRALWEYYRVVTEGNRVAGALKIKMLISYFMVIAVFFSFTGLILTKIDKITFSFTLITIGLIVIGIAIFLFFILFTLSLIFLLKFGVKLDEIARNIEKLQRDMLFEKIDETELKERFNEIYPYINYDKPARKRNYVKHFFNKYIRC